MGVLGFFGSAFSLIGKLLGIIQRKQDIQTGRNEQAQSDLTATVEQATDAAKNRSDVSGLNDATLDSELQPPSGRN